MRPYLIPIAFAVAAGLAGCAGTRTQMISEARPAVAESAVNVYYERPPGSIDIAWVESTSGAGFGTQGQLDAVIARLRREAGKLGANGVVVLGRGRTPSPVGMGVGVGAGSWGSHGGGGVSVGSGVPLTQETVSGIAVWVPAGAAQAQARADLEQRLKADAETGPVEAPAAAPPTDE